MSTFLRLFLLPQGFSAVETQSLCQISRKAGRSLVCNCSFDLSVSFAI